MRDEAWIKFPIRSRKMRVESQGHVLELVRDISSNVACSHDVLDNGNDIVRHHVDSFQPVDGGANLRYIHKQIVKG
jgi:hypothetical protein